MADAPMTAQEATAALEVLAQQEQELCFSERFGSVEALELGTAAARLAPEYSEGYSVTITRESDGAVIFQWITDDKGARNLTFAAGKRAAALKAGHASPWLQLQATANGEPPEKPWAKAPDVVPACGAFPLRVGSEWVATIAVSGLHEGLDHEVIIRALEQVLGKTVPRFATEVA